MKRVIAGLVAICCLVPSSQAQVAYEASPELRLLVHELNMDGGNRAHRGDVWLMNEGEGPLIWSATVDVPWLAFDHRTYTQGTLIPRSMGGGSQLASVHVVKDVMPTTDAVGHVTITSNGGDFVVPVYFTASRNTHGGALGAYADPAAASCTIEAEPGNITQMFIVHTQLDGAAAIQFSAPQPDCMQGMVWLGDQAPMAVTIGNSQVGVSIGYGVCASPPVHVLTVLYMATESTSGCCTYEVQKDPRVPSLLAVDCLGYMFDNVSAVAASVGQPGGCACGTVSTRETTWGQLKSLFHAAD